MKTIIPVGFFMQLSDGRLFYMGEPDAFEYGSIVQNLWPSEYPSPRWREITSEELRRFHEHFRDDGSPGAQALPGDAEGYAAADGDDALDHRS